MFSVAHIANGSVDNISVWSQIPSDPAMVDVTGTNIGIGWNCAGGVFTPPTASVPAIQQTVSRFQAQAALFNTPNGAGGTLLDSVNALMAASTTPMLTKLAWQNAQVFERNSPTVATMAAAMSLTSAQLDQLFIDASKITA